MQAPTLVLSQAESTQNETAEHLPVEDQAPGTVLPPAECTEALAAAEAAFEAGQFDEALSGFRTALQVNDCVPVKSSVSDRKSEFVFVVGYMCTLDVFHIIHSDTKRLHMCVRVCIWNVCM